MLHGDKMTAAGPPPIQQTGGLKTRTVEGGMQHVHMDTRHKNAARAAVVSGDALRGAVTQYTETQRIMRTDRKSKGNSARK